jgi:glycosyltransferase involved in cell wall biosynthesis
MEPRAAAVRSDRTVGAPANRGGLRIGVDATCWENTRGYGRHGRALLSAMVRLDARNHYTFFVDSTAQAELLPREASCRVVRAAAPAAVAASSSGRRSLRDLWCMSRALSQPEFDLLLFPTIYSYVPVFSRAKKVVMIHDVIAETYPELTLPSRAAKLFWQAKVAAGRRQADAIVTVSDYSRRQIAARFKLSPERVYVVGEASDPVFRVLANPQLTPRLTRLGLRAGQRSVIYVGGFGPHKNLEMLVAVFGRLASGPAFGDVVLVLVGEYEREVFHSQFQALRAQVDALGLASRVIFTGYLPDDELVVLLNRGTVLALPSLMEGFGLPAVEAAACGCPVVATTASPLPGLLGDGGRFVDPTNPRALEQALGAVLGSEPLRRQMREAGLAAARRLTWEAAAGDLIRILESTAQ